MHEEEEWDQTSEASRAMKGLRSFPSVDTKLEGWPSVQTNVGNAQKRRLSTAVWKNMCDASRICIIMNFSNNNKPKEDQHTHEMCSHNLKIIKTNRNQETIEQMLNMQWEEADHNVHEHTQKSFRSIRWSPLKVDRVTTLWLVTTPTGKHDSTFNWRRPVSTVSSF